MKSRKSRKPEKTGGKLTLQSAALGCTVLAAVLAGAWVLFPQEIKDTARLAAKAVGLQPEAEEPKRKLEEPFSPLLKTAPTGPSAAEQGEPVGPQSQVSVNLPSAEPLAPELPPPLAQAGTGQPAPPLMSCSQAADSLRVFTDGLDKKDYIKEFKLKQPVRKHLDGLKDKLAAKPPTVIRETDDLYTVIANTAHFFRVLGKDNIQLVKTLLEQEQGKEEEMAAALYAASIGPDCPAETMQLPFNAAYEYAVFFLNTIGGRSYLFRREAKIRLLITYYALLLIDEADIQGLNRHGMEISGLIQPLIREMETTSQLTRKEEYLARLRSLAERYPVRR